MSVPVTPHSPYFATAPQITPAEVADFAAMGFRTLINNRPDREGGDAQALNADIEREALAWGLTYHFLPVVAGALTEEQAEAMAQLLLDSPKPILAFCRSGTRSTYLYHYALDVAPHAE